MLILLFSGLQAATYRAWAPAKGQSTSGWFWIGFGLSCESLAGMKSPFFTDPKRRHRGLFARACTPSSTIAIWSASDNKSLPPALKGTNCPGSKPDGEATPLEPWRFKKEVAH